MSNVRLLSISSSLTTDCVLCEGESCDSSMTLRFMTYGTGGEKNRKVMWCALSCKTDSYDSEIMRWLIWGPGNDRSLNLWVERFPLPPPFDLVHLNLSAWFWSAVDNSYHVCVCVLLLFMFSNTHCFCIVYCTLRSVCSQYLRLLLSLSY